MAVPLVIVHTGQEYVDEIREKGYHTMASRLDTLYLKISQKCDEDPDRKLYYLGSDALTLEEDTVPECLEGVAKRAIYVPFESERKKVKGQFLEFKEMLLESNEMEVEVCGIVRATCIAGLSFLLTNNYQITPPSDIFTRKEFIRSVIDLGWEKERGLYVLGTPIKTTILEELTI